MHSAHKLNAVGDFYVEDGCCLCCDVPRDEAPELFEYDESKHCYVCKQPTNENELNQMLNAIRFSETECIRYRGDDPQLLTRLNNLHMPQVCDAIDSAASKKPWWKFW